MTAKQILDDQVIHVKRGRTNGLGFEPAFNSYFDFYLDSKYFGEPLLQLGDVTFHLYLRKNLNDKNKSWKMPTIRQMRKKFAIGNGKIYAMLDRLEKSYLLNKESGTRKGEVNTRNDYILSDPISALSEFLEVATEGIFGLPLLPEYKIAPSNGVEACYQNSNMDVTETVTRHVTEMVTDQQTLKTKQTLVEQLDPRMEELRFSVGEKLFDRWLAGAQIISTENGTATIGTPLAYARDWIENRLSDKIKRSLGVDTVRCVVVEG